MANLLNTIIANQGLNGAAKPEPATSFTFDTTGKIKPLKDKATLLPSRIFGSPIEYAKDLKQDVLNIGKAAKGKANDHELGRINDLAMKLGSLGIASYLFVKNPLKMSKAMEFAGFGTFFASMALWPKLAIQAPLKARTGVDFQQKYVDSQGRKKMLYQDPQYVLTDLLPREDLDKIGKKMGVDENLNDRDSFIKQRAHKTALQANTLWMMTAGVATPVMSALMCNVGEKGLKPLFEKIDLNKTKREFLSNTYKTEFTKNRQAAAVESFKKFLEQNKDKPLDDKMLERIAKRFNAVLAKSSSLDLKDPVFAELKKLSNAQLNQDLVKTVFGEEAISKLSKEQLSNLGQYLSRKKEPVAQTIEKVANLLTSTGVLGEVTAEDAAARLTEAVKTRTVGDVKDRVGSLYHGLTEFSRGKRTLEKYMDARIGKHSGSYIANQWEKFGSTLIDALSLDTPLTTKELRKIADGDVKLLEEKIQKLVSSKNYEKTLSKLMKIIDEYESKMSGEFLSNISAVSEEGLRDGVSNATHQLFDKTRKSLAELDFIDLANRVAIDKKPRAAATLQNTVINRAESEVLGARSSFYRLIETLNVFKQIEDGSLSTRLTEALTDAGKTADEGTIKRLTKACKDVILSATTVDHVEKLKSKSFGLSEEEYKMVSKILFGDGALAGVESSLKGEGSKLSKDTVKRMMENFQAYRRDFTQNVVNWKNGMRPDTMRHVVDDVKAQCQDGARRNDLVGKVTNNLFEDLAKNKYNSKKWLLMFGGTMAALTAVTLVAGLTLGRKGNMEKQAEEESKKNV